MCRASGVEPADGMFQNRRGKAAWHNRDTIQASGTGRPELDSGGGDPQQLSRAWELSQIILQLGFVSPQSPPTLEPLLQLERPRDWP